MPLSNLLSIARSALFTYRRAMDITANNVANAQTPGYSRQRLEIVEMTPVNLGDGLFGRGVTDAGVIRVRDRLLDAGFRRENGLLGQADTSRNYLGQIEAAVGEPTNSGVAAGLDAMFQSFGD